MSELVVLDLSRLLRGTSVRRNEADEFFAYCPHCRANIYQEDDKCSGCGAEVIWKNSVVWRKIYGSPEAILREKNGITPATELAKELMSLAGANGFKTQRDAADFYKFERRLGIHNVHSIFDYVFTKKRESGIGAVIHVVRAMAARARSLPENWKPPVEPDEPQML